MNTYFVAGGTYTDLNGDEWFDLVCPGPGEPPYVLPDNVTGYFSLVWQNAHLYRVEEDYSLSLVTVTPEALQWGVKAPVKVWPGADLVQKIQAVIKQTPAAAGDHGPEESSDAGLPKRRNRTGESGPNQG